eukprot:8816199-Alexandrium_andersonii.AAC.1
MVRAPEDRGGPPAAAVPPPQAPLGPQGPAAGPRPDALEAIELQMAIDESVQEAYDSPQFGGFLPDGAPYDPMR